MDALKLHLSLWLLVLSNRWRCFIAGTVFAAKGIDNAGDKLQGEKATYLTQNSHFLYEVAILVSID